MKARRIARFLLLAGLLTLAACRKEAVLEGATQRDASAAIAELAEAGIPATRVEETGGVQSVMVDPEHMVRALKALNAAGLPRRPVQTIPELFPGTGLIVTPFELKVRLGYAQDEALRRQIIALDGVADAEVHVGQTMEEARFEKLPPLSAAAVVTMRPAADATALTVKVRSLIAASVPGLDYDRVTVIPTLLPAVPPMPAAPATPASAEVSLPLSATAILLILSAGGLVFAPRLRRLPRPRLLQARARPS